jgi:hypothetical protein
MGENWHFWCYKGWKMIKNDGKLVENGIFGGVSRVKK